MSSTLTKNGRNSLSWPPVDLYLNFEKSSSTNWDLTCKNQFRNWFLQATQAVKIKFKLDKQLSSLNSIFETREVKNQVQINRVNVCMWSLHRIWPNCSFNCNYPRKPWMSNSALCTLGHKIYWIKWNFNELLGRFQPIRFI